MRARGCLSAVSGDTHKQIETDRVHQRERERGREGGKLAICLLVVFATSPTLTLIVLCNRPDVVRTVAGARWHRRRSRYELACARASSPPTLVDIKIAITKGHPLCDLVA